MTLHRLISLSVVLAGALGCSDDAIHPEAWEFSEGVSAEDVLPEPEIEAPDVGGTASPDVGEEMSVPCVVPSDTWAFDGRTFDKPDAPPSTYSDQMTKPGPQPEIVAARVSTFRIGIADHHEAGRDGDVLWGAEGEPLSLSFLLGFDPSQAEDGPVYFSAFVDHEPVPEMTWTRWHDDRGGPATIHRGSGFAFSVEDDWELVDLHVPPSHFTERRTYEITLHVRYGPVSGRNFQEFRRWQLFHGGYRWPELRCYESPRWDYYRGLELEFAQALRRSASTVRGLARPVGLQDPDLLGTPFHKEPGEVVEIDVLMENPLRVGEQNVPVAAYPLLNGAPVGGEPWLYQATERETYVTVVRRRFRVALPDESGIYDFNVAAWHHAQTPAFSPSGAQMTGDTDEGSTTNTLRFVVD